jgi:serine/threonine-protein kinase
VSLDHAALSRYGRRRYEVYRAHDFTLERDVAIKILPPEFAAVPERLERFRREARTLVSLNHPNIAAIYGLEKSRDADCLVLELVESETLKEPIARGRLQPGEALPLAKQIADALEAAHERGVIRRDLKPSIIKVRADGMVKLLDFGAAKAIEAAEGPIGERSSDAPARDKSALTQAGITLGTLEYMSPEQASGRATDRRTDIWAFGVVFFEMLAGQHPSTLRLQQTY